MSLMYSWDPRVRRWVKEPSHHAKTAPPPAEPIDIGAVQTYFFDAQSGRWSETILGDAARRIAGQLGERYRSPAVAGLALEAHHLPQHPSRLVPTPDQVRRIPRKAWLAGVAIAIAVGVYATMAPLPPAPPLPVP